MLPLILLLLGIISLSEAMSENGPKEILDSFVNEDYAPNSVVEDGFKSISAILKPSTQSYDEYGNIVLNGRMAPKLMTSFNVMSTITESSQISVTFCRQDTRSHCSEKGLVLCFRAHASLLFPNEIPPEYDGHIRYVARKCKGMNGISVSTESTDSGDMFRIDTRYGNTYRFRIPSSNCFILWFPYETLLNKTDFDVREDYRIHAISAENDIIDVNETAKSIKFFPNWQHVATDVYNKPLTMLWKEVALHPHIDDFYSVLEFKTIGSGPCCALTAKIRGEHVSKCYHKWTRLGDSCRAAMPEHKTECVYPYVVGFSGKYHFDLGNSTTEAMSGEEENQLLQTFGSFTHNYLSADVVRKAAEDTLRDVKNYYDIDNSTIVKYGFGAGITVGGELKVPVVVAEIKGLVDGHFEKDNQTGKSDFKGTMIYDFINKTFDGYLRNAQAEKVHNILKNYTGHRFAYSSDFGNFSTLLHSSQEHRFENHTVRNIVSWPDVEIVKQLRYICMGYEIWSSVTADFTNNVDVLRQVEKIETKIGYQNQSQYSSCPFYNEH